jgi:hypothetical protein
MPKFHIRIVACLLVPSLMADPALATARSDQSFTEHYLDQTYIADFNREALAARLSYACLEIPGEKLHRLYSFSRQTLKSSALYGTTLGGNRYSWIYILKRLWSGRLIFRGWRLMPNISGANDGIGINASPQKLLRVVIGPNDANKRLDQLHEQLPRLNAEERISFVRSLMWVSDWPTVVELMDLLFSEKTDRARELRTELFQAALNNRGNRPLSESILKPTDETIAGVMRENNLKEEVQSDGELALVQLLSELSYRVLRELLESLPDDLRAGPVAAAANELVQQVMAEPEFKDKEENLLIPDEEVLYLHFPSLRASEVYREYSLLHWPGPSITQFYLGMIENVISEIYFAMGQGTRLQDPHTTENLLDVLLEQFRIQLGAPEKEVYIPESVTN